MTVRGSVRIDNGEYARCLGDTEAPFPYKMPTGTKDTLLGWWRVRTKYPDYIYPGLGSRLIVSEPEGAEDDIQMATRAWRVLGNHGFEVAAETGHRITDVAKSLGYMGVYGVALGSAEVATLVVASHIPRELDAMVPELIGQTNKQLEGDMVPLRLPLEGRLYHHSIA